MRSTYALTCVAIELFAASSAGGQARVDRVIPGPAGVIAQRAGALSTERGSVGMTLQPGDVLGATDTSLVELSCATKGATTYRLKGPFRVLIDVPLDSLCHVNLLAGHGDVLAEEPTNTTAGGIALGSKGTQYSIDVTRAGRAVVCKVVVFEGAVSARASGQVASQGARIQWTGAQVATGRASTVEIERSAALYASFDVAAARAASPGATTGPSYDQLKALHYAVLANPTDTAKRVELAKRQIQYKVDDQAAYNLKRANVTNDEAARRYQIDPAVIRANPKIRNRLYGVRDIVARPDSTGAAVTARPPTTDSDLRLIATGRAEAAIRNLESRTASSYATSRDHYALAKAYDGRDPAKVRQNASRALILNATDGKLSAAELKELGELLGRAR